MRKRPSYQWYPGDFKRDTGLQACSFMARSVWREMLDLMHDGEPYGHLAIGGVAMSAHAVSRMIGIDLRTFNKIVAELEQFCVYSVSTDGLIYSRRMVRDEARRNTSAEKGELSLNHPNVPKKKDPPKDIPEGLPLGYPSPSSSEGSAAFASASAYKQEVIPSFVVTRERADADTPVFSDGWKPPSRFAAIAQIKLDEPGAKEWIDANGDEWWKIKDLAPMNKSQELRDKAAKNGGA